MLKQTKLVMAALFTPRDESGTNWGLPLVLIGKPGVAKSSTFTDIAEATDLHFEAFPVGERGEAELGTVPMPKETDHGTVMSHPGPEWALTKLRDAMGDEAGIVLIDELNTAPPALQPALMGAILDKRFGGHKCGGRVRIMGAMNPVGHAASGWDLAAPTANRFGHLHWEGPTVEEWTAWLTGGGSSSIPRIDVAQEEARVMQRWPAAWAKATGLVAAFILRRPEFLHKQPADNNPDASGAWPSPRTWEFATRAIAAGFVHDLSEIEVDELITAYVGGEAAAEYIQWQQDQDLPNPADLLDGNVTWQHDGVRFDRTIAVLASCLSLVSPAGAPKRAARSEAMWKILADVMKDAKDLVVAPATGLARAGLTKSPAAKKVMASLHLVISAAKG